MKKQDNYDTRDYGHEDDISLVDMLLPLWHSRRVIAIVTLTASVCGLAGSLYLAQYESEGFYHFGGAIPVKHIAEGAAESEADRATGITLSNYKRFSASYATSDRFADYVNDRKLESTASLNDLSNVFASRDGISKLIEPVYPFTKLDAKALIGNPKDDSNNVIGLRISYVGRSPEIAQQVVGQLGSYVMDSIAYQVYSEELRFKQSEFTEKITRLENAIIRKNELLDNYHRRESDLKHIVSRYPESSKSASRQVISVTEDSARYLSPITLLVTTEVQASEAKESIRKYKREQQQSVLWLEYYRHAKELLDATRSGEALLLGLESVKESVFKNKNLEDDVVREVYNMITIDNQNAIDLYLKKSRFVAGPTLPVHSTAHPLRAAAVGLMLGLFLSAMLVFARNWWRNNWKRANLSESGQG